jgi:hypothetical protein
MTTDADRACRHPTPRDPRRAVADVDGPALPDGVARQALQTSLRLLELVESRQQPAEMSQALAQVGRCLKSLAAYGAAENYLAQALRWAAMVDAVDARVEIFCELAEVASAAADALGGERGDDDEPAGDAAATDPSLASRAARDSARDLAYDAATAASRSADSHWEAKVLLRLSDVLVRCGDHDDAASMQLRAMLLLGLTEVPLAADAASGWPGRARDHLAGRLQVAGPTTLM